MNINKVFIAGNLTRDPDLKSLPSGAKVCNFSIATNRIWKDASGARQEAVDYHNIAVYGRSAEVCAQYLRKGSTLFVEGRLQTRSWEGQDGKKQYRTDIIADKFQFVGARRDTGNQQPGGVYRKASDAPAQNQAQDMGGDEDFEEMNYPDELNPEDIPF